MRTSLSWLLAAWLMHIPSALAASDSQVERASLTGLSTMSVVVEDLAPVATRAGMTAKKKTNWRANGATGLRTMTGAGSDLAHGNPITMPIKTMRPAWAPISKTSCRSQAVKLPATESAARSRPSVARNSSLVVTTQ